MSIVNIGLQGIGVMRRKMSDEFEKAIGTKLFKHIYCIFKLGGNIH